jgi:peptidyl-prolyl cis-trans isomerase A (cyclophilin A)
MAEQARLEIRIIIRSVLVKYSFRLNPGFSADEEARSDGMSNAIHYDAISTILHIKMCHHIQDKQMLLINSTRPLSRLFTVLAALFLSGSLFAFGSNPRVILETTAGDIEIEVFQSKAPISAGDFLAYVDQNLYAGGTFYRVVTQENDNGSPIIEVIQGGLTDKDKVLPPITHETTQQTGILHTDGVVSLGRGDPGTGSAAEIFICIGDQPALDFGATRNPDKQGFAAFGQVVDGMDVVRKIQQADASGPSGSDYTAGQILAEPVMITGARRVEN